MKKSLLCLVVVCTATAVYGATAQSASRPHAATRMTSSIVEGTRLSSPIPWQARFHNVPTSTIIQVKFLIDGRLRHTEERAPYFFAGDGNRLLPGSLKPGSHTFAIVADLADGAALTAASTAVVSTDAQPFPKGVLGLWKRRVTAADVQRTADFRRAADGETLPIGTWTVRIGADGRARYTDPTGLSDDQTIGQVIFEPAARLAVGSNIPNVPGFEGYFCHDNVPAGRYQWALTAHTLVVRVISDHDCADRNSFWTGTFTR